MLSDGPQGNLVTAGLLGAAAGGFAWQVHGFWWGIAVLVAYNVLIIPINWFVAWVWFKRDSEDDWTKLVGWFQAAKWILFAIFALGIMISGAEIIRG
jgi:hypothetical protein